MHHQTKVTYTLRKLLLMGKLKWLGATKVKFLRPLRKFWNRSRMQKFSIKTVKPENGHVSINFVAAGNTANSVLNIALVQKKSTTEIEAGENRGVTLTNYNVVRQFKTFNTMAITQSL